jgi:hypothetical protein
MTINNLAYILTLLMTINIAYGADLKTVTADQFIAANPSPERNEIVNFLINQFEGKSVDQKNLDQIWNNRDLRFKYMMARFQIVNQNLYADSYSVSHYYFPTLLKYFQTLVQQYKIPDVDFIIYLREEIPMHEDLGKKTMGTPAFIMFKDLNSIYETDKILFPDAFFLVENNSSNSWQNLTSSILNTNISWQEKINKIFWRGMTTGNFLNYNIKNFNKLPRLTATILSKLYPDLIDAAFSLHLYNSSGYQEKNEETLAKFFKLMFPEGPQSAKPEEHLKYKYLLSIDGSTATGTRVPWIMLSNSVLLKQESPKKQWFYSVLKPYINYVPVDNRLTNIFSQLEWMKAHDSEVNKISQNAQNFVKNNLMPEHIEAHIVLLLNQYHIIQKDKIITPSLPKAEDTISLSSVVNTFIYRVKKYFRDLL